MNALVAQLDRASDCGCDSKGSQKKRSVRKKDSKPQFPLFSFPTNLPEFASFYISYGHLYGHQNLAFRCCIVFVEDSYA